MPHTREIVCAVVLSMTVRESGAQSLGSPPQYLQQIVWAHAPVVLQETNSGSNVAMTNHLLRVDFDGDIMGGNNGPHAAGFQYVRAKPTVYYSIVESGDFYYIGYHLYHAADGGVTNPWGGISGGHEHDMESFWVAVWKGGVDPYGTEIVGLGAAHGNWNPAYSASYFDPPGPFVNTQTEGYGNYSYQRILHWYDPYASVIRPVIMVRKNSHGTYAAQSLDGTVPDQGCSRRTDVGTSPDGLCGIYGNDHNGYNHDYAVGYHGDANLLTYWPWPYPPCSLTDGCNDVATLPPDQAVGTTWYNLISFVDSPLWKARGTQGVLYNNYGIPFPQGEFGLGCFLESDPSTGCGAQPPWAFKMAHCSDPVCWDTFGRDNNDWSFYAHPWWRQIPDGSIFDSPALVMSTLWNYDLSTTYIYNPFRPGYSDPTLGPPLSATIDGTQYFNSSGNYGTWTATTYGGTAPFRYVWTGEFGTVEGQSVSATVNYDQTLYLDVYDSGGWHYATSVYLHYCGEQFQC